MRQQVMEGWRLKGIMRWGIGIGLLGMSLGCGVAPRHFRAMGDPSALKRARAVGLGKNLPDQEVIPLLIGRLEDHDPVVRISANEELRRRTGQNFGFVSWSEPADRAQAVERWKAWWNARQAGLANSGRIP
jgi:HEAT repeat protein